MKNRLRPPLHFLWVGLAVSLATAAAGPSAARPQTTLAFTVSMDDPASHVFRVVLRADGFVAESLDFKMPVWMPGYYGLQKYPDNVLDFRAADGAGKPLEWEKSAANAWRVKTGNAPAVVLSYGVKATVQFIVHSYLDENRAYIAPVGVFMHPAGRLDHPATVKVVPYEKWKDVATGLDPVSGEPNVFSAPHFDVLYDCPILVSNLDRVTFDVWGIPHSFVGWNLGDFDHPALASDLKRMVESAVAIVGDIPYKHYTFLAVGPGQGGIEHANSTAVSFGGFNPDSRRAAKGFLSFLAHEYFHLYNVKTIRPVELGPFDYDGPNRTRLLWMAEGFTSYYQNIILRRAGFTTADEMLASFGSSIASLESRPGRLVQTAAESSWTSWEQGPFGGDPEKSISYYEKGSVIGLLMDLAIRHATRGAKSLDDVMKILYFEFHKAKNRGFSEAELKSVCERVAGVPLDEIFDYANTTKPLDYAKHLGFAGLEVEPPRELDEPDAGFAAQDRAGALVVTRVNR
ncbi:MAG: M61 family metallopeptidase, partial [Candidatus Aminicenantes bacterium]|nr:M61 family metallopeptidase [Candidatus Aminicenantes bacterium]